MPTFIYAVQVGAEVVCAYCVGAGLVPVDHYSSGILTGAISLFPVAWSIAERIGPDQQEF